MPNSYLEIHKTYWRHLFSSWVGVVWLIGSLGFMAGSFAMRRNDSFTSGVGPVGYFVIGSCFADWLLWGHFRELVVNLNRKLFPHSAAANVVVFTGFAMIVAILWPAMLRPTLLQALPLIAFALAWFAFAGWLVFMASPIAFMVGLGLYFWFGFFNFAPFDGPLLAFLQGNHPLAVGVLAVIAIAAIILVIAAMIRLSADSPRFNRAHNSGIYQIRAHVTGETNQAWTQQRGLNLNLSLGSGGRVYIPATNSLWDRAKRWRQLSRGGIWFALFFVAVITMVQLGVMRGAHYPQELMPVVMWMFFMPPMYVLQSWLRQWRFLEVDTLRPMARQQFLAEAALAIAIDLVQCWAIFLIPPVVLSLMFPQISLPAAFVPIAVASLIFNYTLILCLLRWRSFNTSVAGVLLITMLEIPLALLPELDMPHHWPAWAGAVLFLIIAAFLWRAARRCWLIAELG